MTAERQNFSIWTGEDKNLVYTIDNGTIGASVNVSTFTAEWRLSDEPCSGSLIRYVSGGSGITISGCTITVALDAAATAGCAIDGTYWTELSACDQNGKADVLATGWAIINRRIQ